MRKCRDFQLAAWDDADTLHPWEAWLGILCSFTVHFPKYLLFLDMEEEPSEGTVSCSIPHYYWLSSTEHNEPLLALKVAILLAGKKGFTHCLRTHTVQIDAGGSRGRGTRAPPGDWSMQSLF